MNEQQATRNAEHAPNGSRHTDRHQVDIGTYNLLQGGQVVGELIVREDPAHPGDVNHRVEHWGLYSSFANPSPSNSDTTLRFVYTRMEYAETVEDFLRHLSTIGGVRYIMASCSARQL